MVGVGGLTDTYNDHDNSGFMKSKSRDVYPTDSTDTMTFQEFPWHPRPKFVVDRKPSSLPQRGFVDPAIATKHQMVELVPGSKVYVYQSDKDMAMKHGVDRRMSSQQGHTVRDGTKMARFVMSLFWSEKELIGRTITPTPRNKELVPLDINLLSTILDDATFQSMMKIKTEVIDPEDMYSMSADRQLTEESDYNYSMLLGHPSDPHTLSTPGPYMGMFTKQHLPDTSNVPQTLTNPELGIDDNQSWSANKKIKTSVSGTGKQKSKPKYRVRDYVCKYCGKIYHHTTRLKNHVKQNHSKQMKNETLNSAAQESRADSTQTQTGEKKGGGTACSQSHDSKCQHCNKVHQSLDKSLTQHEMEVKCYREQKNDLRPTEVLREENEYYLTNEEMEDVEQSGSIKASKVKIPPINQSKSRRRTRSSTRLMKEAQSDPTQDSARPRDQLLDNDVQQDHIRLEVMSYQKDEEICRRQVMLSGMLFGDRHSSADQLDDVPSKKKTLKSGNESQVSTSAPDTSGNATDGANIQFWCKCGKSFTSLSTFVVHKFPCEAAVNSDKT